VRQQSRPFGVGIYFWLILGAVLTSRLFFGSPLPQPLLPVLSILLSPPGTASLVWFAIDGGEIDHLQAAVGGITVFMLLIQLLFVPSYLRLPFSAQHWIFAIPLAALGNIGIRWSAGLQFDGWRLVSWIVLAISTASILAICAGSARDVSRWLRRLDPRSSRTVVRRRDGADVEAGSSFPPAVA
jgi:tellurite resistance protein